MVRFVILAIVSLLLASAAWAEQRYALLIGNEDYSGDWSLERPHEDVDAIRTALIATGWPRDRIKVLRDASLVEMDRAVTNFAASLKSAGSDGVGFFYFSGHGGSLEQGFRRRNFLIPAKSGVQFAEDLRTGGYRLDDLLDSLQAARDAGVFVVVDACRNTLPSRSGNRGAEMKGLAAVAPPNIYLAFATADGELAPDDGLYADLLATEIRRAGQDANTAFFRAANAVQERRGKRVRPVLSPARIGEMCFAACALDSDTLDWEFARSRNTRVAYEFYLDRQPQGRYRAEALAAIGRLGQPATVPQPAPVIIGPEAAKAAWSRGRTAYDSEDYATARREWTTACASGEPKGCTDLGLLFSKGLGGAKDEARARELSRQGCDGGNAIGCTNLGFLFRNGLGGAKDEARARELYRQGCDGGDANGCGNLGGMIYYGQGGAKNVAERTKLMRQACRDGREYFCGVLDKLGIARE